MGDAYASPAILLIPPLLFGFAWPPTHCADKALIDIELLHIAIKFHWPLPNAIPSFKNSRLYLEIFQLYGTIKRLWKNHIQNLKS